MLQLNIRTYNDTTRTTILDAIRRIVTAECQAPHHPGIPSSSCSTGFPSPTTTPRPPSGWRGVRGLLRRPRGDHRASRPQVRTSATSPRRWACPTPTGASAGSTRHLPPRRAGRPGRPRYPGQPLSHLRPSHPANPGHRDPGAGRRRPRLARHVIECHSVIPVTVASRNFRNERWLGAGPAPTSPRRARGGRGSAPQRRIRRRGPGDRASLVLRGNLGELAAACHSHQVHHAGLGAQLADEFDEPFVATQRKQAEVKVPIRLDELGKLSLVGMAVIARPSRASAAGSSTGKSAARSRIAGASSNCRSSTISARSSALTAVTRNPCYAPRRRSPVASIEQRLSDGRRRDGKLVRQGGYCTRAPVRVPRHDRGGQRLADRGRADSLVLDLANCGNCH